MRSSFNLIRYSDLRKLNRRSTPFKITVFILIVIGFPTLLILMLFSPRICFLHFGGKDFNFNDLDTVESVTITTSNNKTTNIDQNFIKALSEFAKNERNNWEHEESYRKYAQIYVIFYARDGKVLHSLGISANYLVIEDGTYFKLICNDEIDSFKKLVGG